MTQRKKVLFLIVFVCFIVVALLVSNGLTTPIETFIYSKFQTMISQSNTIFAKGITYLCDPKTVILFCIIIIAIPYTRSRIALPVSACAASAAGLNWIIKQIFVRERPNLLTLVTETGYSFPSGHSATSAAIGTIFVLLIYHFQISKPKKNILIILCCIIPFLIGLSRIYLGVHYLGDVMAGWLLGILVGIAVYSIWNAVIKRAVENQNNSH